MDSFFTIATLTSYVSEETSFEHVDEENNHQGYPPNGLCVIA